MDTTVIEVEEQEKYQDTVFNQLDFQKEILNSDMELKVFQYSHIHLFQ